MIRGRRSIRLKDYDYAQEGAYFVTICTKNRECVLADLIVNGIINDVWLALTSWFPTVILDEFVVMPNHIHLILWLIDPVGGIPCGYPTRGYPNHGYPNQDGGEPCPYGYDGVGGSQAGKN